MLLGVDVGGTFTDAALVHEGSIFTSKVPTTPADQSRGVLAAVGAVLERAGARAQEVKSFAHGMTVATNALLEGRGARTALVATAGFTDLVELGRQARPSLYRLCQSHPRPLVPAELRFPADERMSPEGPVRALDEGAARGLCDAIAAAGVESVAVVLLHSYRHPEHERMLGRLLRERLPDAHVSLSHEVVGTFREFERAATTEVDAALSPLLAHYLRRLADRAGEAGLPEPAIMQSNGGLADAELAAAHASITILSGPAGGAAGAAFAAAQAGERDALCFDMGGTSCDVCVVRDGSVAETSGGAVGGRPLALPMLDVHTIGAGGGSIAWRDPGGALRVGPQSAGAEPGPACYGRGGRDPTVTDANLLLGYLSDGGALAGHVRLDRSASERAIATLAGDLGLGALECAEGIARVATNEMARALRVATVEQGVDPRAHALVAFGGAGPMHAAAIADELGVAKVVCPRASGVLAALGLVIGDRRRDAQRSVLRAGGGLTVEGIARDVEELARRARAALGDDAAALRCVYELRYRGQAFELPIEASAAPAPDDLRTAFEAAHRERYGYADPEGVVELVTIRVTAVLPGPDVQLTAAVPTQPDRAGRRAVFDGRPIEADGWRGELPQGFRLRGPAICELPETTVVVPPGWHGEVDASGALKLERAS